MANCRKIYQMDIKYRNIIYCKTPSKFTQILIFGLKIWQSWLQLPFPLVVVGRLHKDGTLIIDFSHLSHLLGKPVVCDGFSWRARVHFQPGWPDAFMKKSPNSFFRHN
jgi:hypothetical protein